MATSTTTGSPCGACKFLRRKCSPDCIFAPYFCSQQGSARFAAIHKVFGASNAAKMLSQVPVSDRCEAVVTIAYEAQARVRDPVYGCVAHIFALQQQVACLQAQLMQFDSRSFENPWMGNMVDGGLQQMAFPTTDLHSMDSDTDRLGLQDVHANDDVQFQSCSKKMLYQNDLGELQALALRMMRN